MFVTLVTRFIAISTCLPPGRAGWDRPRSVLYAHHTMVRSVVLALAVLSRALILPGLFPLGLLLLVGLLVRL